MQDRTKYRPQEREEETGAWLFVRVQGAFGSYSTVTRTKQFSGSSPSRRCTTPFFTNPFSACGFGAVAVRFSIGFAGCDAPAGGPLLSRETSRTVLPVPRSIA